MDDDGVHRVNVTGLAVFFYNIDGKIESLMKDLNNGSYSSEMIRDIGELNSVHRGLRNNWFNRILLMYTLEGGDDQLIVVTDSPQDFVVVESTIRFFARKLHNIHARADRLFKDLVTKEKEASSSSISTRGGTTKTTMGTDDEESLQSSSESDEDTVTSRFTENLGVLFVPRTTFAHRLGLPEVSDDDWKLVEAILAESTDITIELSLSLAELYIQLLPRDNTEGMSDVYEFLGNLKKLSKENPNRDVVKWMRNVCKVAFYQHYYLEGSEKRQQGEDEAIEVKILLKKFMDAILFLETVNDFSDLPGFETVTKAVEALEADLRSIRLDLDEIETTMTERRDRDL